MIRQKEVDNVEKEAKLYGVFKGTIYALILYMLLWWLPVFGPMIAGYVAGRKAGSPVRGVLAVFIPIAVILAITYIVSSYVSGDYIKSSIPPGMGILVAALTYFVGSLQAVGIYIYKYITLIHYAPTNVIILLIFAYIGGLLSQLLHGEQILARYGHGLSSIEKRWHRHPEPVDSNMVVEEVKPSRHTPKLIKLAERQKHIEYRKRKREPENVLDTL